MEELQREGVRSREEAELLQREVTTVKHPTPETLSEASTEGSSPPQNSRHRQEILDLSTRNLELSSSNAELSARLHDHQGAVQTLEEQLEEELSTQRDQVPARTTFSNFLPDFLLHFLFLSLLQLGRLSALEAELNGVTVRLQRCEEDRKERELEAQEQKNRVSWTHLDSPASVTHSRGAGLSSILPPRWRGCSRHCTLWRRRRSYCAPSSALSIRRSWATPRK